LLLYVRLHPRNHSIDKSAVSQAAQVRMPAVLVLKQANLSR
jgi:hypothetical protein